jgi:hypothetical protein
MENIERKIENLERKLNSENIGGYKNFRVGFGV